MTLVRSFVVEVTSSVRTRELVTPMLVIADVVLVRTADSVKVFGTSVSVQQHARLRLYSLRSMSVFRL